MDYYDPNDHWLHRQSDDMNDDDRMKAAIMQCVAFLILLIVGLALCALLGSCSTAERVVTVERVRTDTTYITKQQRDSIYIHDSTAVEKKDSIIKIEHWHTKYVDHAVHDTLYKSKTDSIPVPYPVIQEVAKPLTKTQKWLMGVGALAIMAMIVGLAWKVKKFLP